MATKDFTRGQTDAPATGLNFFHRTENVVDSNLTNLASADVAQVLDALKGFLVMYVVLEVLTAEGATLTVDVGDGTNPDAFLDGVDGNAAANTMSSSAGTYANATGDLDITTGEHQQLFGIPGGKFYTAADTIDILVNDAAATASLRLTMAFIDMRGSMTFGIAAAA